MSAKSQSCRRTSKNAMSAFASGECIAFASSMASKPAGFIWVICLQSKNGSRTDLPELLPFQIRQTVESGGGVVARKPQRLPDVRGAVREEAEHVPAEDRREEALRVCEARDEVVERNGATLTTKSGGGGMP
jgi:hypothetical protein